MKYRSHSEVVEEKIRRAKLLRELENEERGLRSRLNKGHELADLTVNVQNFLDLDTGASVCDRFTLTFDLCGKFIIRAKYNHSLSRVPMLALVIPDGIRDDFTERYLIRSQLFKQLPNEKTLVRFMREKDIYFLCRVMHGRTIRHQDSVSSMLDTLHKKYVSRANWEVQLGLHDTEDILLEVDDGQSGKDLLRARRRFRARSGLQPTLDEASSDGGRASDIGNVD